MRNFLLVMALIGALSFGADVKAQTFYYGLSVTGNTGLDSLHLNIGYQAELGAYLAGGGFDKNDLVNVTFGYFRDQFGFDHYPVLAEYSRFFGGFFGKASIGGQFVDYGSSQFYFSAAPVLGFKVNNLFGTGFSGALSLEYVIFEQHPDYVQARITVGL